MTFYEEEAQNSEKESPFTIDPTAALSSGSPSKPKPLKAARSNTTANQQGGFIGRQSAKPKVDGELTDEEIRALRKGTNEALKRVTVGEDVSDFVPVTGKQRFRKLVGPMLTLGVTIGIGLVLLVAVGMMLYGMVAQYEAQNTLSSAHSFLKQGNAGLARRHLEPLVKGGIKDPAVFSLVGVCSNKLGEPQRALEEFSRASQLAPKEPAHLCGKAEAYLKLDKPEEAITEANAALGLNPQYADALRLRAAAYVKQGKYQNTLDDTAEYMKLSSAPTADVYANRALALFNMKRFKESADDYAQAVQIEPENGAYWTAKAESLKEGENYKEAIAALNRALSVMGKKLELLRPRADCHLLNGQFDEALKDYELICQLSRKKADYVKTADVAASGKRNNLALFYYSKALEADPNDDEIRAKKDLAKKNAGL